MAGYQQRLGQRVRTERKRKGWSRERLAQESGVSYRTIQRIEAGKTEEPRDGTLEAFSTTLDIPLDELQPPNPFEEAIRLQAQLDRMEQILGDLRTRLDALGDAADVRQSATASTLSDLVNAVARLESAARPKPTRKKRGAGG